MQLINLYFSSDRNKFAQDCPFFLQLEVNNSLCCWLLPAAAVPGSLQYQDLVTQAVCQSFCCARQISTHWSVIPSPLSEILDNFPILCFPTVALIERLRRGGSSTAISMISPTGQRRLKCCWLMPVGQMAAWSCRQLGCISRYVGFGQKMSKLQKASISV